MMKNLSERITENSVLIENAMKEYLSASNRRYYKLIESMQYSACSGGKRIRPFLTIEFCRMLGGNVETSIPYACAIEMIHSYSLIHDDLPCMDNDDYRRGKLTNHKKYGEAEALLAGDSLLTYAFGVAASNKFADASTNIAAVRLISENAGFDGMVGGQMLDLIGNSEKLTENEFMLMNKLKTGCLIKTACLLGCLSAGFVIETNEYKAAEKYAEKIGLAFQIEDDILDAGTEDNKNTFLSFMSIADAKKKVAFLTEEAKRDLSFFENCSILSDFAEYLSTRTL